MAAGGSTVAPVADRASQRPKTVTSQGDFHAMPPPVCAADDVGAGYGLALTCEVSSSVAVCVAEAAG
jgi:hypothetical protein